MNTNTLVKANKLNKGDTIAVVSLSWGGPGAYPYRFECGKKRLESIFDLKVVPTQYALRDPDWLYQHPEARADDLMEAFLNPNIKGIFSSIGGDDSIRLLPYIDLNVIKNHPKILLGFSDTTITHFACFFAGLSSFYGPAVMTAFAENVSMHQYTIEGIKRTLFDNTVLGNIPENLEGWTKEFLNWAEPSNQNIKRKLQSLMKWNFIGDTQTIVRGRLIGGCVEVLQFLNGTHYWPTLQMWKNSILFLETSEENMESMQFQRFLRNLAAQGILQKVKGILFSKPGGHKIESDRFLEYDNSLLKIFEEYNIPPIPMVTNMDFGHSDPMWTLPYGCLTEINPIEKTVSLLENSVL